MTKLKLGFYGITGCAGCLLSFIFNEDEILTLANAVNIIAFPFVKEINLDENFDYVFIEGLVASKEDLEVIKKLRKNSKKVVSLGACSCTGCVPAYRHFTLKQNYEHLLFRKNKRIQDLDPEPIDSHIKVDYYIQGCPPSKPEILNFIKSIANNKIPLECSDPVCNECRKNNNPCLLELGKPCLGPITKGGCDSVCINGKFECWGCRGPTNDLNLELMIKILKEKGYSNKFIHDRLRTFAGLKLPLLKKIIKK